MSIIKCPELFVLAVVLPMLLTCAFCGLSLIIGMFSLELLEKFMIIALVLLGITLIGFAVWAIVVIFLHIRK